MAAVSAQRRHQEKVARRNASERKAGDLTLFDAHDADKANALTHEQVRSALAAMFEKGPSDQELIFLFKSSMPGQPRAERAAFDSFQEMLRTYKGYLDDFRDPKGQFSQIYEEHDTDKSGGLNKAQLRGLLEKSRGKVEITDQDVDYVMSSADLNGDGEIHKIEFRLALAVWFQRMCQPMFTTEGATSEAAAAGSKPPAAGENRPSRQCVVM